MCGIAGIEWDTSPSDVMARLRRMLGDLHHRGPDDTGLWEGDGWALGMTRLAVQDVQDGRQPMVSADGRWVLVFNGEVYNFKALRDRLRAEDVAFRTRCDTEVFLEAIAQWGFLEALEAVEGMFAAAALNLPRRELWLARDRFGEKPLYLDRRDGGFAFCSELMPLVECTHAKRQTAPRGLLSILRYGHPWPGLSAVEGIGEVRPGQWLRREVSGGESAGFYWRPPTRGRENGGLTADQAGSTLLELLDASVRDRLVADVPIGLFLSGGIDSGAVASSAARERPDIHAVTVGFSEAAYDERPLARATATTTGILLDEESVELPPFSPELIEEFLQRYGQPFADTSAVPTRAVSRAARRRFTVVLSGDGGDELLSGYVAHARQARLARWGGGRAGASLARVLASATPKSAEHISRGLALVGAQLDGTLPHVMAGVFTDRMLLDLTAGTPWAAVAHDHIAAAVDESRAIWAEAGHPQLAMSLHQIRHSMPQDILTKVDRMSMAESLEVRAPFLDSRLATFALELPPDLKMSEGLGKFVLRWALRGRLPEAVLRAPKRGFAMPVRRWLGRLFWDVLETESTAYCRDSAAEFNLRALTHRITTDRERCLRANDYRALHRGFLLYTFFLWRRGLLQGNTAS
jgi:asparagine synthase (glutamine-hydrolysing)